MADSSAQDNTRVSPKNVPGSAPAPATGSPLPPGSPTKIGRFEVRAMLGEGAFGRVYRGYDEGLRRDVAIKVPHTAGLDEEFRERFLREARAIANINHPNVCPVYEVGVDGELPFIIMRFVAGTTLADIVDNLRAPMPPRNAVMIVRKLALGMAAAHAQGVTHRDLKPANVLYETANREVLITDFGLARVSSERNLTAKDSFLGTPAYTSPEQANRQIDDVGPLSDVYSLGVILYEMLVGDVPFNGSVMEVAIAHCITPPTPPSQKRADVDAKLDAIVLKVLSKKPAERYPSAKAFADVLTEYLRPTDQSASTGSAPELSAVALAGGREPEAATETVASKPADRRTAPAVEKPKPAPAAIVELDEDEDEAANAEAAKETRRSDARKTTKQSKAKKKKKKAEASPLEALLQNKIALAGIALGLVAVVLLVVVLTRKKSEPETAQKPAPDTGAAPAGQPQQQPPKVDPPKVEPKAATDDVRLRNLLLGRWRITTGVTDLMSAQELAKLKADKVYFYLEFKSDGVVLFGIDSFDPEVRVALAKDYQAVPVKFRAVGANQIEFVDVPPKLQKFGPFVRGAQSNVRIDDDTLTLRSSVVTKLLRVVLN